ncbi:MAG TPA: TolC family protein [Pyrinomonadaceae bacterium]|jgi:HAE1 family hydrophobic/amphiphilic exporter-1|nr:TolC family protein [Pyrinomonadaceae bacterium]
MNDILKTARAAAFVVAACAMLASGAHARQQSGAGAGRTQTPPSAESRPSPSSPQAPAQSPGQLPADPPAVAPNYEAPARALPSVERIGVEVGEPLALTLGEAIRLALENNNDIEATRIDVTVAEHELTAARGAYDLRFTSETYFERSETPVASFLAGGSGGSLTTTDMTGRVGFEGLSPRAGGSYKFEFTSRRLNTNNAFNDINPTVSNGFSFSFTQPLLRGRKTDDTRRRVEIAKKNLSLTDAQFRRRATEVITNVEQAYWELAYALRNLQIQIDAVRQARAQADSDRRQVEKGVIAPVDLLEAETQVKNFEQNVYAAQEGVSHAENNLKKMLAAERSAEIWSKALLPVTPVDLEAPRVALGTAVESALTNRLELAELDTSAEINKIDQRFYRDQTRPQVDLTASYGSNALAGSLRDEENPLVSGLVSLQSRVNQLSNMSGLPALPTTNFGTNEDIVGGYGQSLKNLFAQNNPTVKVGVKISLPFRNRTAQANFGRAVAEGRRVENRRAKAEQIIEAEVRDTLQALRSVEARLAAASSARSTAEQQYQSERRKFQSGMSTTYMVSQRQIDLISARGRELQAQTDLNKTIADFRRATGSTLQTHNVALRPNDPARRFEQTNRPAAQSPANESISGFDKE